MPAKRKYNILISKQVSIILTDYTICLSEKLSKVFFFISEKKNSHKADGDQPAGRRLRLPAETDIRKQRKSIHY